MNIIKIAAGIAISSLILLFFLVIKMEKPEKALFDKTVESLMIQNDFCSSQEVLDSFPKLKDIKAKIEQTAYLNSIIRSMTGGPAPDLSTAESLEVQNYTQEINQLRKTIEEELSKFKILYAEVQP